MPELPGEANPEGAAHREECAACAAAWERQQRLTSGLRALRADSRATEAPERVEAALVEAFRRQRGSEAPKNARWWWVPAVSWAAAAIVLVGLVVLFTPKRQAIPAGSHTGRDQTQFAAAQTVSHADTASGTDDAGVPAELGEGFIALPNAERIGPNEDVNVVRMELPRSAMTAVGLDVNPDRVPQTVEADVVLGSDGLARAVRFVDGSF